MGIPEENGGSTHEIPPWRRDKIVLLKEKMNRRAYIEPEKGGLGGSTYKDPLKRNFVSHGVGGKNGR